MMEALFSVDALWFTAFSFYDATRAQWSVVAGWLLLNLVMHELGHAGASLAFGRPVEAVRLGARPVLLRIRSRRVGEWRIGLPLPNGATYYDDAVTLARWRAWLCTAAGPGANLALAAGAMFAHAFSRASSHSPASGSPLARQSRGWCRSTAMPTARSFGVARCAVWA